ncbi:L-seryl-tRNA(Sec) selenium transferase [Neobacillus cucumis]|uniref:L-seryl-tRNA(Sec) selenium transferase n=1 Tax=Neobacillus cucumis TaxID=1740721 RepID=UPI0018DF554C|nr:L-seryl-tRNA(Sec) selenium transferase [Neobacillus cucumis]MBI0580574.1 L-seryl-tRNA(Sec) selenium transferase [Neobacillus cucumis]WHY89384.1 L-seryl-tRNA(Sec) selenium transferase [Neobacillus cucumis]
MKQWLRSIPAVHELQNYPQFLTLLEERGLDFNQLTKQLKEVLDQIRNELLKETWKGAMPGSSTFIDDVFFCLTGKVEKQFTYTLEKVINATGTILHTNLGRARLSEHAIEHVVETARNYSNLEYLIDEGKRGSRHTHVEALLKEITGAEAVMVVNNNAAAVYLVLSALAKNKEVIVSRGQLVEIGGSFRISSIMEESGARLVEVGTTNKTHLFDYEEAITPDTSIVMKVHTSNFKVIGFTKSVATEELIQLTRNHEQIIFYEDLGSGALFDFRKHGIGEEPLVKELIAMGADLLTFSGDKLLGGPQAGIIAGKKERIDQLKKHQLARVVRVDKMTLAALEGTLMDYVRGEKGLQHIPTIRDLLVSVTELDERSQEFVSKLIARTSQFDAKIFPGSSQVGGGTMPDVEVPTMVIALKHKTLTAEQLGRKLRTESEPAIIGRIHNDEFLIDLRTVTPEEEALILNALTARDPF